jgi:hypothetical protein
MQINTYVPFTQGKCCPNMWTSLVVKKTLKVGNGSMDENSPNLVHFDYVQPTFQSLHTLPEHQSLSYNIFYLPT